MQGKLDPFHAQIVIQYLQTKQDFLNVIQVKKDYRLLLDRFRINPIRITNETKNLFQCLYTQQLFGTKEIIDDSSMTPISFEKADPIEEITLSKVKRYQYNYEITYSEMKKIEETIPVDIDLQFKKVVYSKQDRKKYGNEIPKEVSILGERCFQNCKFSSFVIPTTVTRLKFECFERCKNLKEIIIPDSVISINQNCFKNCSSLSKIVLSSNLQQISFGVFQKCYNLKDITIPPYLQTLEEECFSQCGLEEIEFPSTLECIRFSTFSQCKSLTKVDMSKSTKLKILESEIFQYCTKLKEIILNDCLESINFGCFKNCSSLETVLIPSNVSLISLDVFKNCIRLKELTILNKKCLIGRKFIKNCTSLEKLQMPTINGYINYVPEQKEADILERNGIKIFDRKMKEIKREKLLSIEYINNSILDFHFKGMSEEKYTSLYIPSTITSICLSELTRYPKLKELILPAHIQNSFFVEIDDQKVKIDYFKFINGKTCIDDDEIEFSFYKKFKKNGIHCKNVSVSSDDKVSEIPTDSNVIINEWNSFKNNIHLKEIPSNIIKIFSWNFIDKTITSLTIPSTVKKCCELNNKYFKNLVELKCYKHHVENTRLIDSMTQLTKIEVLDGSLDDILVSYKYYLQMKDKGMIFNNVEYTWNDRVKYGSTLPSSVKIVEWYSPQFYSINELIKKKIDIRKISEWVKMEEFEIPFYQTKIYNFNFFGCSTLTNIKLHDGIKEIHDDAFSICQSIKTIKIPSSVTFIGKSVFNKCFSLTSIEYDGEIDGNCISECYSLLDVPVLKSLEPRNFFNSDYLSSIRLKDTIEKIPGSCFNKCLSLSTIIIPSCCTEIDVFAFKQCISLKEVLIPKSVKKINEGAFYGCINVERIVIENEEIKIGYDAFGECSTLKEIVINGKKIEEYEYEVNYSQMKRFKEIGIECNKIVIRREDVEKYGKEILNDTRVHRIHDNCFRDNEEITELIIPNHITKLGMFSFSNCKNLTKLIIPTSVREIPYCCFEHCSSLKEVQLPDEIKFDWKCFWQCHSLSKKSKQLIPKEEELLQPKQDDDSDSDDENGSDENLFENFNLMDDDDSDMDNFMDEFEENNEESDDSEIIENMFEDIFENIFENDEEEE